MGIRLSLIWLVMAVAASAQIRPPNPPVLDTDGHPLRRGAEYYINPALIGQFHGSLTLVENSRLVELCPKLFVGEGQPSSSRLPVTFVPVEENDEVVRERKNFKATFSKDAKCGVSTTWKVGKRDLLAQKRLIETGDGGRFGNYFLIERSPVEGKNNIYILRYCPTELCSTCKFECGNFETLVSEITGDRLMSLGTDGTAIAVQFERVLFT